MSIADTLKKVIGAILALGLLGAILVFLFVIYISLDLPKISSLNDYNPPLKTQILSADGHVLLEVGKEKREVTSIDNIPQIIIDSFLAAEDDNFYSHSGVDYLGVMRAMVKNIKAGKVVQGGSTITQQVAKSLLLTRERSYTRKIKDFILAQRIEKRFTKKEILFLYLNQVYLGGGYYGVKSAFRGYFEKDLSEATIAESALVAGLLVAPGRYSPYVNPQYAKKRQLYVLSRLLKTEKISKEQHAAAVKEKIRLRERKLNELKAGYFSHWVKNRLEEYLGEDTINNGGYLVKTTLNWKMQQVAEREALNGAKAIDKRQGFKGPLKTLNEDEVAKFELEQRKSLYKERSNYFFFHPDASIEFEFFFQDKEVEFIEESRLAFKEKWEKSGFVAGYLGKDKVLDFLEENQSYEGVVLGVNDRLRIAFVSIAGVAGIIDYEGFRWAHKREITVEKNLFPYIQEPSEILKRGDVVLVKIESKKARLTDKSHKGSLSYLNKKRSTELEKENYLLLSLDQDPEVQSSLIAMDPEDGKILSMVGGNSFFESQFNRAIQAERQPGSSFKPLLFALALENGYTPATQVLDSPEALGGVDGLNWKPRNYDGKFKGPMTFRRVLELSRNVPSIKIASDIGLTKLKAFVERIGFKAEMGDDLTVTLGSFGVKLIDLVRSYALFPNGGKKVYPKSVLEIYDRDGNPVDISRFPEWISKEEQEADQQFGLEVEEPTSTIGEEELIAADPTPKPIDFTENLMGTQVYDKKLAYIMTNILKGVMQNGTGRSARYLSTAIGGKSGTTNDFIDALFLGFSSKVVLGVWAGFDDNQTLGWGESGSKAALPIWKGYMSEALKEYGEFEFRAPRGIINVKINKSTGDLASPGEANTVMESFVEGTQPGRENISQNTEELDRSVILEDDDYFSQN